MTTTSLPEIRQTLPGRSRAYRLYTVEHVTFDTFYEKHALVVTDGWGTSRSETYGEPGCVVNVYPVPHDWQTDAEWHPLDKQRFDTAYDAKRAVFEAGITAFMVYVDRDPFDGSTH